MIWNEVAGYWCWMFCAVYVLNKWHPSTLRPFFGWYSLSAICFPFTAFNTQCVTIVSRSFSRAGDFISQTRFNFSFFCPLPYRAAVVVVVVVAVVAATNTLVYLTRILAAVFFLLSFRLLLFAQFISLVLNHSVRSIAHSALLFFPALALYATRMKNDGGEWVSVRCCYIRLMHKTEFMMTSLL